MTTMSQHKQQRIEQSASQRWMRASTLSGLLGGGLAVITALAMLTVQQEVQPAIVDQLALVATILLALALPAFYVSERDWFDRFATAGFWLMASAWAVTVVAFVVDTVTTPGLIHSLAFLGVVLGLLAALIGAIVFGIAVLRTDDATVPRLGAWLFIATLPVGLPFTIGFTALVMGQVAELWAGPFLLYGLAWIVFGHYLWSDSTEVSNEADAPTA